MSRSLVLPAPALTKLHADVLVGVVLPELVILITVAHHGEDDLLEDGQEVRLDQLPRGSMVHSVRTKTQEAGILTVLAIDCIRPSTAETLAVVHARQVGLTPSTGS